MWKKTAIFLGGGLVLFSLPMVWYYASYGFQFHPVEFEKQYWEFYKNILSLLIGFLLVNVFWPKHEREGKVYRARALLLHQLRKIQLCDAVIYRLINRVLHSHDDSLRRDDLIDDQIEQMKRTASLLDNLEEEPDLFEDATLETVYLDLVSARILPLIQSLPEKDTFRNDYEGFNTTLDELRTVVSNAIQEIQHHSLR